MKINGYLMSNCYINKHMDSIPKPEQKLNGVCIGNKHIGKYNDVNTPGGKV